MRIDKKSKKKKTNKATFYLYCAEAEQDSLALIPSKSETAMEITMDKA